MDRITDDLARYVDRLNEGRLPFGGVTLCHPSDRDDVLRCDEHLRARWRNFTTSLRAYDDDRRERAASPDRDALKGKEGWWLSRIELDGEVRHLLGPVLSARENLRTLILDRNEFGRDGVSFLCGVVERNPHLRRLSFHNNPMEDDDDVKRFCEAVRGHPSLTHLSLENVGLGDDEEKISMIMEAGKNLYCLGLSRNGMKSRSTSAAITGSLASNNNLKIVYLRDNVFGDDTSDIFASMLRDAPAERLCVLDLSGNGFSHFGATSIRNALFDTSSLNAVMESNHGTVVYTDESNLKDRLGAINCKGTSMENRKRKVLSILYTTADRGRLGELLDDVPLGLTPNLLAYLQEFHSNDIPRGMRRHAMETLRQFTMDDFDETFSRQTAFTIVFEVSRSWNLPSLFEKKVEWDLAPVAECWLRGDHPPAVRGVPWKGQVYELKCDHNLDVPVKYVLYLDNVGMWQIQRVSVEGKAFEN